jgi:hypothetical protein
MARKCREPPPNAHSARKAAALPLLRQRLPGAPLAIPFARRQSVDFSDRLAASAAAA